VVLLLVVGLIVAGLQTLPLLNDVPTPNPSEPSPSASSSSSARPTRPSARPTSSGPAQSYSSRLTRNPIYPLTVSGSCPAVQSPQSRNAYREQVDELLNCLAVIFRPLVEESGNTFLDVDHKFYEKRISTPCGSETDAYAFYCQENHTIYFSEEVYDDARYARLIVADVVIHEYGHHVQAMAGILDAADDDSTEDKDVVVRREELQVFCWTYYVFASVPTFGVVVEDHNFFRDVWGQTSDPEGHGSVKAQEYWGARGLEGKNLGACNTWTTAKDKVR